ncbi:TonB-dependent receptor [Aestuariicella hydrocarbonica]|uniref:TonB-dependent receptor n=1 Tax=Pseudomaricurvus hydrocarbonicus TaxID=1470433 RepID=A0A9E5T1H1_9GAMM|nr:TonB-dependent receptor [Aestuariicella hydrocarbonica]NHO67425.1 TonB-dependent receptor [Aestuariicella hydrocarbonica]
MNDSVFRSSIPSHIKCLVRATQQAMPASVLACSLFLSPQLLAQQAAVLEEVTVTAQRRAEKSEDVPISITAISADMLGKGDVQQLSDIMKLTPGLRFDNQGSLAQPTIRGVGTAVAVSGGGSNVGIYTDGFLSPNPFFVDSELLNVESVQVLKGPQGTLFGRNSTGGAILVTTVKPDSDPRAEAEFAYGSYDTKSAKLYATGGPSDDLAFDLAAQVRQSDNFDDNITTGSDEAAAYDNWMVRLGARWDINDQTSLIVRYTHTDTDNRTAVTPNGFEEDGRIYSSALFWGGQVATDPDQVSVNFQPEFLAESDVYQMTLEHQLEGAVLTSYTQYRRERTHNEMDFDFSSATFFHYKYDVNSDIFTQEFLLASDSGSALQWTTGLFLFMDDNEFTDNQADQGAGFVLNGGSGTDSRSIAAFGDVTYALMDRLFLTGGLRLSYDKTQDAYLTVAADGLGGITQQDVDDISDTNLTPRVVMRYTPTDNSSVYASYTQGFKAGLLNVGSTSVDGIDVDPEEIRAYEVGYKYASNELTFDVAAFYYDYQDLQVATYDGPKSLIENAADSRVYGMDAQLRLALTHELSVNVGGAYVNAEYENFDRSQAWEQCLAFTGCAGSPYGIFVPGYVEAAGFQMQRSPELTANLGVSYSTLIAGGTLDLSSTFYYTSDFYFDSSEQFEQDSYELLSARAQWTAPSERYSVAVYGDNLTDAEYRTQVLPQQLGAMSMWGAPATLGISLNVKLN